MTDKRVYTSKLDDLIMKGKPKELVPRYERYGYEAERQKMYREAHNFWQHAEHYKKLSECYE